MKKLLFKKGTENEFKLTPIELTKTIFNRIALKISFAHTIKTSLFVQAL